MSRVLKSIFLLLLLLPASRLPAANFPVVKEITLQNKMKFLLVSRGETPIFSAYIRFKVGGMDEEIGKTGLAHFMEHMAFKGTEKIDGTALTRLVEQEGGEGYNATTSKDMTSYMVSFPSDRLRFWAELESERIFKPVFREFEQEKAVVMEERRMRVENDPDGKLHEEVIHRAFTGTPYEWSTLGSMEDLQKLTPEDLKSFWERHYQPANAVGVLVGHFDLREAESILKKTFGRIPNRQPVTPVQLKEIPPLAAIRYDLKEDARPRLVVGYLKPTLPQWEDYVFDLIDQILTDGRSSRLYRSLIQERKLAAGVESYNGVPGARASNLFLIQLTSLGRSAEELLHAFDEEIARFQTEGPSEREVQKGLNRLLVQRIWGLKTNQGLAAELSYFEILGGWRYLENYPEKISAITAADIQKVAQEYLQNNQRIVGVLAP